MLKVGSVPHIEKGLKDKRLAGQHKPVFVHAGRGGYRMTVSGFSDKQLPSVEPDLGRAVKRAKKWIQRRRGTCLKRPQPVS